VRPRPPLAFSIAEQNYLLGVLDSERFADTALIAATIDKQNVAPGTLTLHADRGTSMRSKSVAQLLVHLDVTKTHSRPHVSDDNPYSEAHRHSGIALMPPDTVHYGRSTALTAQRGVTLDAAFIAHPARFKGVAPRPPRMPLAVWINPPKKDITPPTITPNCSLSSSTNVSQTH
jgi:putative transposase